LQEGGGGEGIYDLLTKRGDSSTPEVERLQGAHLRPQPTKNTWVPSLGEKKVKSAGRKPKTGRQEQKNRESPFQKEKPRNWDREKKKYFAKNRGGTPPRQKR